MKNRNFLQNNYVFGCREIIETLDINILLGRVERLLKHLI